MPARSIAKSAFYATGRWLGINALLRRAARRRLLVLCYHGVISEDHPEDPVRTRGGVARGEFREQLSIVGRLFNPVSADDVLASMDAGAALPDYPVLITFDDGFRNNLTCAAPELERQGIPAVIFVATGLIGTDRMLWTQELNERILGWRGETIPAPSGGPDTDVPPDPAGRGRLIERIRGQCKEIPDGDREAYLDRLRDEPLPHGEDWHRELYDFLSWDEVRSLTRKGFAVGSHTIGHRILTRLTPQALRDELCRSKAKIEAELGRPCPSMSYPNGGPEDVSPEVVAAVEEAGYKIGFTLLDGLNAPQPTPLEIKRTCVVSRLGENAFHAWVSGLRRIKRLLGG